MIKFQWFIILCENELAYFLFLLKIKTDRKMF